MPVSAEPPSSPLIAPGDAVPAPALVGDGGPAGRELAPLIGQRPVLGVWWRPKDAVSEQALVGAHQVAEAVAPEAVFFPMAGLAAGQPIEDIPERLAALGLKHLSRREDTGQLALMLGVRLLPCFFLVDAGGVLRLIGGSDITQNSAQGLSIAEALAIAAAGGATPTLGRLPSEAIFRMLGRKLPDVVVTELDGATHRKLRQLLAAGKRLLIFYWSPQCPHCRAMLPRLAEWRRHGLPADVVLVDIARGDAPGLRAEAAVLVKDLPWIHLLDVDQSVSKGMMIKTTPAAILVAPEGDITGIRTGESIHWDALLRAPARAAARP